MFALCFLLWLLMAGEVTASACLWGAAVSALLSWFCRRYLGYRPMDRRSLDRARRGAGYILYLVGEMLRAGFVVMKLVYTRGNRVRPRMVWFETTLAAGRDRAVLANSITLTAGTITVVLDEGRLCVHALDGSLAEGLEDSPFQRRLKEMED